MLRLNLLPSHWWVCWSCLSSEGGLALRMALVDEYMESVIEQPAEHCHVACQGMHTNTKGRIRRIFSVRQGRMGSPEWVKCPVCLGPCTTENLAETV